MEPDVKELLKENLEVAKENNQLLHSMRRSAMIGTWLSVIKWTIILGSIFGAFYFLEPMISRTFQMYEELSGNTTSQSSTTPQTIMQKFYELRDGLKGI